MKLSLPQALGLLVFVSAFSGLASGALAYDPETWPENSIVWGVLIFAGLVVIGSFSLLGDGKIGPISIKGFDDNPSELEEPDAEREPDS